jgi:hypothetical protein
MRLRRGRRSGHVVGDSWGHRPSYYFGVAHRTSAEEGRSHDPAPTLRSAYRRALPSRYGMDARPRARRATAAGWRIGCDVGWQPRSSVRSLAAAQGRAMGEAERERRREGHPLPREVLRPEPPRLAIPPLDRQRRRPQGAPRRREARRESGRHPAAGHLHRGATAAYAQTAAPMARRRCR